MPTIYQTDDGGRTEEGLMWDYLKSTNQIKEYDLFKKAIIKKQIHLNY